MKNFNMIFNIFFLLSQLVKIKYYYYLLCSVVNSVCLIKLSVLFNFVQSSGQIPGSRPDPSQSLAERQSRMHLHPSFASEPSSSSKEILFPNESQSWYVMH